MGLEQQIRTDGGVPKGPGISCQLNTGEFGIAYHKEQVDQFVRIHKVVVHIFTSNRYDKPVMDRTTGQQKKLVVHHTRLTKTGYID